MLLNYDLNQSSAVWTIPTSCVSLCNITSWSTVSNTADRSRSNMMTMFWLQAIIMYTDKGHVDAVIWLVRGLVGFAKIKLRI